MPPTQEMVGARPLHSVHGSSWYRSLRKGPRHAKHLTAGAAVTAAETAAICVAAAAVEVATRLLTCTGPSRRAWQAVVPSLGHTVGSIYGSSSSSGGFIGNGPAAATAAATASHLTAGAAGLLPLAGCKSHEQEAGRGEVREAAALTMRLSQESSGGAGRKPRSPDARWHLPWG